MIIYQTTIKKKNFRSLLNFARVYNIPLALVFRGLKKCIVQANIECPNEMETRQLAYRMAGFVNKVNARGN